ncbi:MAG: apolipoprotein N-acyltransferase [Flavobacteriaceae bacterium]
MKYFLLALLSGILFSISWPTYGFPIFIFGAFIPILFVEQNIRTTFKNTKARVFGYAFLTFLIWNFITTGWIYYADLFGMIFAILFNTLMMSLMFLLYHISAKRFSQKLSLLFFASLWMSFEYLHLHWDFSWPWLNLGNVFSENITWIQWYEFTGTFGGSLWVLAVNIFVFYGLLHGKNIRQILPKFALFTGIPIVISLGMFHFYEIEGEQKEVIVLQPNIDPYNEKYDFTNNQITSLLLTETDKLITENTEFVIAPETVLAENLPFDRFLYSDVPHTLRNYIEQHPNVQFLWGIDTYDLFTDESKATIQSNQLREDLWGNFYNMAIFVNGDYELQKYYKSKLVAGIETLPLKPILEPVLGNIMLDLGGTISVKTTQKDRSVFTANDQTKIAPIICYESVYGEYVTGYVKNGADFLAIITNDAWWDETQGHKQHLSLARLRTIETRRDIARSANTGISAFINQKGEITSQTQYNEKTALLGKVTLNKKQTLYVLLGDYIAKISVLVTGILFVMLFFRKIRN